jgi:hypothetical protein
MRRCYTVTLLILISLILIGCFQDKAHDAHEEMLEVTVRRTEKALLVDDGDLNRRSYQRARYARALHWCHVHSFPSHCRYVNWYEANVLRVGQQQPPLDY